MEEQPMSSSDLESTSQTETEDTDTGETGSSNQSSVSSDVPEGHTKLRCDDSCSNIDSSSSGDQRLKQNISIDFTEVTDLDDMSAASNIEDSFSNGAERKHSYDRKNRKSNQEFLTGFPKLDFSGDWYNHSCFKAYWEHYQHTMSWCKKHYQTYSKLQTRQQNAQEQHQNFWQGSRATGISHGNFPQPWRHPYNFPPFGHSNNNVNQVGTSVNSSENRKPKRRRGGRKQKKRHAKSEQSDSTCTTQGPTESEFEMEITQDMIDFFAKSHEHRRLREEEKKVGSETGEEQEHINAEQVKSSKEKVPTVEAPKERPGSRRTAEMKMLYGKGAAMIHGMETALQMAFDRNTDIHQPKYWPNMPLKIVFG